ncbi:hypothetical protein [Martelella soudanensis]|uniref:hypothetical protein n=1 Tax=unclassified Martelella TaxID=2629616 RepID=UPI0015DFBD9B|nr:MULTISPECIES: hypothetical protein [unclassified Martelella]
MPTSQNAPDVLLMEHTKKAAPKHRLSYSGWDRTSFRNQAYRLITSCRQFSALAALNHLSKRALAALNHFG